MLTFTKVRNAILLRSNIFAPLRNGNNDLLKIDTAFCLPYAKKYASCVSPKIMLSIVKLAQIINFLQFIILISDDFLAIWVGEFEPVKPRLP